MEVPFPEVAPLVVPLFESEEGTGSAGLDGGGGGGANGVMAFEAKKSDMNVADFFTLRVRLPRPESTSPLLSK